MKRSEHQIDRNIEVILGERFNVVMPLYRGILAYARNRPRWHIRLHSVQRDYVLFHHRQTDPDGILAVLETDDVQLLDKLRDTTKAVVTFFADLPNEQFPTVALDERAIGRAGAEHLISHGFHHLAYCGSETPWSRLREDGFCAAARQAGLVPPMIMPGNGVHNRPTWPQLQRLRTIARWIARLPRPVGIMAQNDVTGVSLIKAALALKCNIPEQVAVLGVDNDEVTCESAPIPLSSIDTDLQATGYAAARVLDRLFNGVKLRRSPPTIRPRGVVERASSNVLAFEDRDLRQAVAMIREQAVGGLIVAQLAHALSISPRSLQLKFQRELRCRPGDEIRRVRLEHARMLLTETDLKLHEVARQSGYSSLPQLCTVFKQRFNMTLQAYRRRSASNRRDAR